MYSSHLSSSIAILCHRWKSLSLLGLVRVVFAPVIESVVVVSVCRMDGSSMLRYLTIAFLFVMMTPSMARGWLTKTASSCLAGFDMGPRVSFPRSVMARMVTKSSAVGKLKKVFRMDEFLMWSSITCDIRMCRIRRMLRWMNELSCLKW